MTDPRPQFVCFLEPVRAGMPDDPTPEEAEAVQAHFDYYQSLIDQGQAILAGRTLEPPHRGIFIFEADTPQAADALVAHDPGVRAGVFRAKVQPFRVALLR